MTNRISRLESLVFMKSKIFDEPLEKSDRSNNLSDVVRWPIKKKFKSRMQKWNLRR